MLASECDNFLSEINEQHAIANSLRNNNTMSTDSSISDVMDSSVKDTTAATDDSVMSVQPSSTIRVYTPSHLNPRVIMDTRSESLFNFRRRVHLKEVAATPFRPISTLNMHLPNDVDPTMPNSDIRLSRRTLEEFDAFSRGLANEALRRKPEDCIIGNFTDEEMQAERRRQFNLYKYALDCVDYDRIQKYKFQYPIGNHSPLHEAIELVTRSPVTVPNIMHEDDLPTANPTPIERLETLLQSDVDNEHRKRKLRKNDSGQPVDPEASEPESEDEEDNESTEQDHEDT